MEKVEDDEDDEDDDVGAGLDVVVELEFVEFESVMTMSLEFVPLSFDGVVEASVGLSSDDDFMIGTRRFLTVCKPRCKQRCNSRRNIQTDRTTIDLARFVDRKVVTK